MPKMGAPGGRRIAKAAGLDGGKEQRWEDGYRLMGPLNLRLAEEGPIFETGLYNKQDAE